MALLIKKTNEADIHLNSSVWEGIENIPIASVNWDIYPSYIKTDAKLIHNNEGIYVKFISDEHPVFVSHRENNDEVYMDSTVEFFICPNKNDKNHFNFEINAEGYALAGFGIGRDRIRFYGIDFSQFKIENNIKSDGFEVMLFVPFAFLLEHTSEISDTVRCNLYKCCEAEGHVHYLSAFPIECETPNFHVDEAFEEFILE